MNSRLVRSEGRALASLRLRASFRAVETWKNLASSMTPSMLTPSSRMSLPCRRKLSRGAKYRGSRSIKMAPVLSLREENPPWLVVDSTKAHSMERGSFCNVILVVTNVSPPTLSRTQPSDGDSSGGSISARRWAAMVCVRSGELWPPSFPRAFIHLVPPSACACVDDDEYLWVFSWHSQRIQAVVTSNVYEDKDCLHPRPVLHPEVGGNGEGWNGRLQVELFPRIARAAYENVPNGARNVCKVFSSSGFVVRHPRAKDTNGPS